MTARDIATLATTARQAGLETLLDLQIAAELLTRGEATMQSLAHSIGSRLETTAFRISQINKKAVNTIVCREAVGFSMVKLTPKAETALQEFIKTQPRQELLRSKTKLRVI